MADIVSFEELMNAGKPDKGTPAPANSYLEYMNSPGMFGMNQGKWNNMGQLSGLAGSGLNLYDQLWGTGGQLRKEQLGMLKEQRAANQEALANKREFKNMFSNAGSGLASKGTLAQQI